MSKENNKRAGLEVRLNKHACDRECLVWLAEVRYADGTYVYDDLALRGLSLRAQSSSYNKGTTYGWEVSYHEVYYVGLEHAKTMVATLSTIQRKYNKIVSQFGMPQTFGQYVVMVCNAAGFDFVQTVDTQGEPQVWTLAQAAWAIDDKMSKQMADHFGYSQAA